MSMSFWYFHYKIESISTEIVVIELVYHFTFDDNNKFNIELDYYSHNKTNKQNKMVIKKMNE